MHAHGATVTGHDREILAMPQQPIDHRPMEQIVRRNAPALANEVAPAESDMCDPRPDKHRLE